MYCSIILFMKKTNIFKQIPENLQDEIFEKIISSKNITVERIISYGHNSPKSGWYDQIEDEWVILLDGEAILSFQDKADIHLKAGDYINLPAFTKHKVKWTKPNYKTVWLAIFYKI